jgi:hypothetical protein
MEVQRSQTGDRPTAAFVLSLLAGLWMLLARSIAAGPGGHWGMGGYWMWSHHHMWYSGQARPYLGAWSWFGILAGLVILAGAVILYSRPAQSRTWGVIILVVSALSLIAGLGGVLPALLGIVGGILALTWQG